MAGVACSEQAVGGADADGGVQQSIAERKGVRGVSMSMRQGREQSPARSPARAPRKQQPMPMTGKGNRRKQPATLELADADPLAQKLAALEHETERLRQWNAFHDEQKWRCRRQDCSDAMRELKARAEKSERELANEQATRKKMAYDEAKEMIHKGVFGLPPAEAKTRIGQLESDLINANKVTCSPPTLASLSPLLPP